MHYHIHIACLIALFLSMLIFLDDLHEDFILIDLKEIDLNLDSIEKESAYIPISESIKQRVCEFKTENKTICSKEKKQTEICMEEIRIKLKRGGVKFGLNLTADQAIKGYDGGGGRAKEGKTGEKGEIEGRKQEQHEREETDESKSETKKKEYKQFNDSDRKKEQKGETFEEEEEKKVVSIQNNSFFTKSSQNWIMKSLHKEKYLKVLVLENNFLGQNKSKTRIFLIFFLFCILLLIFLK